MTADLIRTGRSLLILASSRDRLAAATRVGREAGADAGVQMLLADLDPEAIRWPSLDAVLVSLDAADLDGLDRASALLRNVSRPVVIDFPFSLVDAVVAAFIGERADLLCDATDLDRRAALAVALQWRPLGLSDIRGERRDERLAQVSEEMSRLARTLAALSAPRDQPPASDRELVPPADVKGPPIGAVQIRAMLRARWLRGQFFAGDLFADPAWDMLLDLMAARLDGMPVSVLSLCIATAVPSTTALRWITRLVDDGLAVRIPDPRDGRRVFVDLTESAARAMAACLSAMQAVADTAR